MGLHDFNNLLGVCWRKPNCHVGTGRWVASGRGLKLSALSRERSEIVRQLMIYTGQERDCGRKTALPESDSRDD
jgi:hypothetical protein